MNTPAIKIIVLDGHTLNPGDLSWEAWRDYGEVVVYDRTPADSDAIVARCEGAQALLTNKLPLGAATLARLPSVKYIGVTATGYNIVDTAAARRQAITVTNVPGYGTASVVQMTFALLLELALHVQRHSDAVRDGKWSRSPNFRWAGIPELLERSDVVSIHCPLVPETRGLINKESLARMKPGAFLLNTSRGPIIVEEDLAEALNTGRIAGAGLDVLATEPPPAGNPLFQAKNCIITPHISWATKEARSRLMAGSLANLTAWMAGDPVNVVN